MVESGFKVNNSGEQNLKPDERGVSVMFRGEYSHTVDTKGRLIIPSKFREQLGEEFIVTRGLDGCLFIFPMKEWEDS